MERLVHAADRVSPDHRSLNAWQLAKELRSEVLRLTVMDRPSKDIRFRGQTEDAAGSVCRNIREGYYRFNPGEFANFVRYAQASLGEVGDLLEEGLERGYWTEEDMEPAHVLCKRTGAALGSLRRYLMTPEARGNAARIRARSQTKRRKAPARHEPKEPRT